MWIVNLQVGWEGLRLVCVPQCENVGMIVDEEDGFGSYLV